MEAGLLASSWEEANISVGFVLALSGKYLDTVDSRHQSCKRTSHFTSLLYPCDTSGK
jgi:hypothetical protein